MSDANRRVGREGAAGLVRLRLLATSDLHMHILPWDYAQDRAAPDRGLASVATLIAAARDEVPNSLLFDNGDFLQGSALGDHLAETGLAEGATHPMIAAMNHLRYDAATLGNHEFSHGMGLLSAAIAKADFPLVASNLMPLAAETNLFAEGPIAGVADRLLLERTVLDEAGHEHRLTIGILGVLPPQTAIWERVALSGVAEAADIPAAASRIAAQLRAAGADIVVALCHSGIGTDPVTEGMENAALPLAAIDGIDAVVAGHSHLVFPSARHPVTEGIDPLQGTVSGKPAVLPGCNGSHLGVIDLLLEHEFAAGWRVVSHRAALRVTGGAAGKPPALPDPAILSLADAAHQATLHWLEQPVGWTDRPLSTAFAMIAPSEALRLVAAAKARHVCERLQGTPHAHLPVLASSAPFRSGGRGGPHNFTMIRRGALSLRHALDLYPHPNTIAALRITGAELVDWLEHAAGAFRHIRAGAAGQRLLDPDYPGFHFDVIQGLDFRIDLSQPARFDLKGQLADPAARRITHLSYRGEEIRPDAEFILATNSYRAGGGGGFAGTGPDRTILSDTVAVRDLLIAHIRTRGTVLPPVTGSWSFAPMAGTSVDFGTSPEARHFMRDVGDLALEAREMDEDGFLTFRLSL